MRGAVVNVDLPPPRNPPTRVQAGRRPAVVLHSEDSRGQLPVTLVVPGTSQLRALRFPHTVRIEPSRENGLSKSTVFLCFQVQPVDDSIIDPTVRGTLSADDLESIEAAVRDALGL